jgi:two-component system response regulator MprA
MKPERSTEQVPTRADAERPGTSNKPVRGRVLLAEDDADLRVGLARLLRRDGHEVCEVSDGSRLLEQLASWLLDGGRAPADVIVTDVRMPGINGLSIVEGLRAGGYEQPIVVISAFGDDEMRERLSRLGRVSFLPKPFDPLELEALLPGHETS